MKKTVYPRGRFHLPFVIILAGLLAMASQSEAARILFLINTIVDPNTTANAHDQETRDRLVAQGHEITLGDDDTVTEADTIGKDLVLISSSTGSGQPGINPLCRNVLRTSRLPVVCYEPGLYDELLWQIGTAFGNADGHTSIEISTANQTHPLAAGKKGAIEIVEPGLTAVVSSSDLPINVGNSAIIIATNATPGVNEGRICIWAYDFGAKLADNNTVTAGRKVAFFFNATTQPGAYNTNAVDLFNAALAWALTPPTTVPITVGVRTPNAGAVNVPLDTTITAQIDDGNQAQVNTNTIRLTVNGTLLTPSITKSGARTTVSGKPASPLPKSSQVTVVLTFNDNLSPANSFTNTWQFTTERPALNLPAFSQNSLGLISIEAENYHTNAAQGAHRWDFVTTPAGYSGEGTMYSLPDSGASLAMPAALTTSPRLSYRINFNRAGPHYLWIRGSDGGGDSIHAGLDDIDPSGSTLDNIDDNPDCCGTRATGGTTFVWFSGIDTSEAGRALLDIAAPGEHTLHIWMREDGQIADKFVITSDPAYVPVGTGPDESIRVGQVQPPVVASIAPSSGAVAVPLDSNIQIVLTDGTSQVATNTIQLKINGSAVTPAITRAGNQTTILHDPASDLPAGARINVELTFSDNASPANTKTFTSSFITVRTASAGVFGQTDAGLISIEAENFQTNSPSATHHWDFAMTPAGFSGPGTMYALPDGPASIAMPGALTDSPRLSYRINFTKTGTHYLWVRGSDGGGDSIHAALDDADPTGTNLDNMDSPDCCGTRAPGGTTLTWVNGTDVTPETRSTFQVAAAGMHTLHLWMREDGMIVDKVVISTDVNYSPTGEGPAETLQGGERPKLSISRSGQNATISWTGSGTLQQADSVTGPWTNASSQANPQTVSIATGARFYRVRQ